MIDTTPKHHFEKNLVHDMKRISTHKLQCSHLIWIGHIPTQSICKLVPHRKRVRACKQKHGHVSHLSLSLSPHKTHPYWILQVIILSPIDNLFFTASHTMKENRGTVWENQTFLLQNTVAFFTLIWSQVLANEKKFYRYPLNASRPPHRYQESH